MTTKYYLRQNICPHCGRYDERLIGISAAGWRFLFVTDDTHKNADDWFRELAGPDKIFDSSGREISCTEFIDFVRSNGHLKSISVLESGASTDGEYDYKDAGQLT